MTEAIEKLAALAAMVRDAELTRLRNLQKARASLEGNMQRLAAARRGLPVAAAPDPAHRSGTDERWLIWAARRGDALSVEAARAAAKAEAQIIRTRRAVGRADVLDKLSKGKGG